MNRLSTIVDPRLMASLPKHFNSLCTIEQEQITQDAYNEEVITYVPSTIMTGIPCYVEPTVTGMGRQEIRRPNQTIVDRAFMIALQGYFPTIDVEDRARVNLYDLHNILQVSFDDTKTITFLTTEIVNSGQ